MICYARRMIAIAIEIFVSCAFRRTQQSVDTLQTPTPPLHVNVCGCMRAYEQVSSKPRLDSNASIVDIINKCRVVIIAKQELETFSD